MTIRHLNIFIAVCEHQSISKAAKALFIAQPTVSQAIKEIEKQFDILLFERLSKKLYITEKGKEMLSYARHISSSFNEMEERMRGLENVPLKIGATITVATCVLSRFLNLLETHQSNIHTKIVVDNTAIIEELILQSHIDVGIVEGKIKSSALVTVPVMEDELVLVCGEKNSFFTKKVIPIKELESLNFVFRERGSGTREIFEEELIKYNVQVNEKWTSNNSEAIKNAVIESDCFSVISRMLVEKEIEKKELHIVSIKETHFFRKFYLTYHKNKFISAPMQCFIDILRSYNQNKRLE